MKTLIVITGLPGAGKTYRRMHDPELLLYPCVDMCAYKSGDWFADLKAAFAECLKKPGDVCVLEGLFLEYSQSWNALYRMADKHSVKLKWIHMNTDPQKCADNLTGAYVAGSMGDVKYDIRRDLLKRVNKRKRRGI